MRQANAEEMVQNILQWLQGVYKQNSRKSMFVDNLNIVFNYNFFN